MGNLQVNRALAALTLASLTAFSAGCSSDDAARTGAQSAPSHDANIDLPPIPPLPLLDIPREYPDGTISVMGLTINRDANMAKKVRVSGLVVDRYVCESANEAPARRGAANEPPRGCLYPHFYLVDAPTSSRRILVTGYNSAYEEQIMENTRYTVSGLYTVQATGFQASEWGIIIPDSIAGSGIQQPE